MNGWWILAISPIVPLFLFLPLLLVEICKDAVKEEARTRLERLPFAILHLAARRLPVESREYVLHGEWQPELHYIIAESNGLPLTRLARGICFSLGLLRGAKQIGTDLEGARSEHRDLLLIQFFKLAAEAGAIETLTSTPNRPPGEYSLSISWSYWNGDEHKAYVKYFIEPDHGIRIIEYRIYSK